MSSDVLITQLIVAFYREGDGYLGYVIPTISSPGVYEKSFTADANAAYMVILRRIATETSNLSDFGNTQFEAGSTATSYEPFQSKEISVTFPSEAGTVYGGTITINPDRTGEMVVDRAGNAISNMEWVFNQNYSRMECKGLTSVIKRASSNNLPLDGLICSVYKSGTAAQTGSLAINGTIGVTTNGFLYIRDEAYSDVDSWIADYGTDIIVYPLATPITYTLTESEISGILSSLYGTNNIWADCGNSTVEYTCDTRLFIEQLTQPTEDDMTADHAISAGTFFMLGNTLYLATSQIAAGATITPGTNATKLSLADALNQLNA